MIKKRFEALDAFRGLCAISVVIFHMHLVNSVTELAFFRGSDIFVEFFFVLSGFVLVHSYGSKRNLKFVPFVRSRFLRLYPLHFFMFIVFIVLEFGKWLAYRFGGFLFNNEPFSGRFAINEMLPNLLLVQSWTPFTNHLTFNYPAWSISIEFYTYILFFISILTFKDKKAFSWLAISFVAFILILFDSDILVLPVLRGLSCFFGGALTYVIYRALKDRVYMSFFTASLIEISLIILIILIVQSESEARNVLASLLFFIVVFFFAFESGVCSKILSIKVFQWGGKLSYSIYMTHAAVLFCLVSFTMIMQKVLDIKIAPMMGEVRYLDFGTPIINNSVIILTLLIIISISHFTYKYIELTGQKLNFSKNFPRKEA